MKNHKSVFAIFDDRLGVERAVDSLKADGHSNADISALFPDKENTRDFAHEKATKAPEGATAGVASGAVLGGGLGWLAGIGALAIPGIGPFIAAGPIMAALAGATVGGAVGGIAGALIGMGIPEYEAKRYEGFVKDGGILISVQCNDSDWVSRAKKILETAGGRDIATAGMKGDPEHDGVVEADHHPMHGDPVRSDVLRSDAGLRAGARPDGLRGDGLPPESRL